MTSHVRPPRGRRDFLASAGAGFGGVALASLLGRTSRAQEPRRDPLAPKRPHHAPKVKSIIWCFLDGGPSHIDLFDPKPTLQRLHGQTLPASFPRPMTAMGITANNALMASSRTFRRHGRSGISVSDWYPEIAQVADELCVVRSCVAEGLTHVAGILQMNTCSLLPGRPSLGAWSLYGLGSECDNLPGFVVLADSAGEPPGGTQAWSSGFLPSPCAGTRFNDGPTPILFANRPNGVSEARQKGKVDFIQEANRRYAAQRPDHAFVDAQIAAMELAYRMQSSAPEVVDLSRETAETKSLYGMDRTETATNGRNCLLARRLVERGVRFVQCYMGVGSQWDAHADLESNHSRFCLESDKPIAGLIRDLKRRSLLDSTLVVWGGEFGRTPMSESGNGRDHNPYGFTMCFAGGGTKRGFVYGSTDELGLYAVENHVHVRDLHATMLHLMGINHRELKFPHNGREEIATNLGGNPVLDIIA
ncbi:MAG: DUF1501 domain-containing protein [Gemmataceae bacterium]|nr:DUF1501 domain-containing protein [Gemmataceae bacterium]